MSAYEGNIGFRTWPTLNTIRQKNKRIVVQRSLHYKHWKDFDVKKIGDDKILLWDRTNKRYYRVYGPHKVLKADALRDYEATVFKVYKIKERLKTKIKGVSLSSWLYPDINSNPSFFNVTFQNDPKATTLEDLAKRMGEKDFRLRYKRNLRDWLNPDTTF